MLLCALLLGACATVRPEPVSTGPDPAVLETMRAECSALWRDELGREIDAAALEDCVGQRVNSGRTIEEFRAQLRASDEYSARVARLEEERRRAEVGRTSRLRVDGRRLVREDGRPFAWRFVTGFQALDYVADGNEAAAVAFLDWARARGFNGVRVLSTLCCWFDLAPADGARALPRLLELAGERGLYVEAVGLAGTRDRGLDRGAMRAHVAAVGAACGAAQNCVVEIANENAHASQQSDLADPDFLRELRSLIPADVPVSMGSNCCGQSDEIEVYPGGDYITVHSDRSRDTWNRTRHVRELEGISSSTGKFVVDDEPIGAGETDEGGRRSSNAAEFFARGVLSRVFGFGATFHYSDGLNARPPGPVQDAAAASFVEGTSIVADDLRLAFKNAGWSDSPVKAFRFDERGTAPNSAVRAFSGVGSSSILALVGVNGDPGVEFQGGWRAVRVIADRPGIRVLEIGR